MASLPDVPNGDGSATGAGDEGAAYQALYRRFRPQRFADVLGQEHVTRALTGAVRDGKVAHAYLFSGPRGTGKTSTARILAMALNCEHPDEGEPDGTCASCVAIRQGSSLDVQELDSATNRGIDEMKDLLSRVSLGTPGRWKVYIIDEVHQLTPQAASALLKTLEDPPSHVIFVLATTDPQKVMPTIRSRTQHFEFRLLGSDVLGKLLRDVNSKASLGLPGEAIDLVVKRGHGSARDALSALDQVAAAGGVDDEATVVADLVTALADRDPGRVLVEVAEAAAAGRDPRRIATEVLEYLRNGFLATQARSLVMLPDDIAAEAEAEARRLGTAALVRAMEMLGQALIDMRDAPDPRVTLEVALVRVASPEADDSRPALLERVERLERAVGQGGGPSGPGGAGNIAQPPSAAEQQTSLSAVRPPGGGDQPASGSALRPPVGGDPPAAGVPRPALGAHRRQQGPPGPSSSESAAPSSESAAPSSESAAPSSESAAPSSESPPAVPETSASSTPAANAGELPSREDLTLAWGDRILPDLRPGVKVYLSSGRFLAVEDGRAIYAVPDQGLLSRAEPLRSEVEEALATHFGRPVPLKLVLDSSASQGRGPRGDGRQRNEALTGAGGGVAGGNRVMQGFPGDQEDVEDLDIGDLRDAPEAALTPEQRLMEAFPGAEEVTP
ncbi:MAG TPA: DNA polymerase III subunit gamma/tau [Acidimicrobiales bacterium]|nr:DNA polymerase III subunit gamma/tau [Acidimicrobiales bacterium]